MKILIITPISGLSQSTMNLRKKHFERMASTGTEIEYVKLEKGPESIESSYDLYLAVPELLRTIKKAEDLYNAVVIATPLDPGLQAAREIVDIPVVGEGETSIHLAASLGSKFSIITAMSSLIRPLWRVVEDSGLHSKIASIRAIDVPVLEASRDPGKTKKRFIEETKKAVKMDNADVIVPGCGALMLLANELQAMLHVPVIDSSALALKTAEMLVYLGITHSKKAYPRAPGSSTRGSA